MNLRFSLTKKSMLYIGSTKVIKVATLRPTELEMIHTRPSVFVQTDSYKDWLHVMDRWDTSYALGYLEVAARVLRDHLWIGVPIGRSGAWKNLLLEHVQNIYPSKTLLERVDGLENKMGTDLIHGDATLENVVLRDGKVRWIDPCHRSYLPADRRVDIAKMFQSCWNYEGVVHLNERALFDASEWRIIKQVTGMTEKDDEILTTWLCVHLARLLRYQSSRVRKNFTEVLVDQYGCKI